MTESGPFLSLDVAAQVAAEIRALARRAVDLLPTSSVARRLARHRMVRPIDYMRYAEFTAVLDELDIGHGDRVLDVGSPQWFSLYLASAYPETSFTYVNIVESELEPFREITEVLGLTNIEHRMGDVRQLAFPDASFDCVISISVIEHVYPEVGGDVAALGEIARVLEPGGDLVLTVPCKDRCAVVRVDGPVYERGAQDDNFFAREYDMNSFALLVASGLLRLDDSWLISEKAGTWSVDYYEWGPGSGARVRSALVRARVLLQVFGVSADEALARRYLGIAREPEHRMVNIAARLRKPLR